MKPADIGSTNPKDDGTDGVHLMALKTNTALRSETIEVTRKTSAPRRWQPGDQFIDSQRFQECRGIGRQVEIYDLWAAVTNLCHIGQGC